MKAQNDDVNIFAKPRQIFKSFFEEDLPLFSPLYPGFPVSLSCHFQIDSCRLICRAMGDHADIRWNPELTEWFCAKCGVTSDHKEKEEATREMETFDCSIHGANAAKVEKERLLRAHYLNKAPKSDK